MEGDDAPLDQQGWKDMVVVDDDDWATILVRFDHEATEDQPYMYHCHILEHEDLGMMGQFTVAWKHSLTENAQTRSIAGQNWRST